MVERFTIKTVFENTTCPNYFGFQQEPPKTANAYAMEMTSGSLMVVGHVTQRATFSSGLYCRILIWQFTFKITNPRNSISRQYFCLYDSGLQVIFTEFN